MKIRYKPNDLLGGRLIDDSSYAPGKVFTGFTDGIIGWQKGGEVPPPQGPTQYYFTGKEYIDIPNVNFADTDTVEFTVIVRNLAKTDRRAVVSGAAQFAQIGFRDGLTHYFSGGGILGPTDHTGNEVTFKGNYTPKVVTVSIDDVVEVTKDITGEVQDVPVGDIRRIGAHTSGDQLFVGTMRDLKIWVNGVLVRHYPMDEGFGEECIDIVSGQNGTIRNSDPETFHLPIGQEPLDGTAPVITLLGPNPEFVVQGENYTDSGFTAIDAVDGDITLDPKTKIDTSQLNMDVVGVYTVFYSAEDSAGNIGTAERTIVVEEPAGVQGFNFDSSKNTYIKINPVTFTPTDVMEVTTVVNVNPDTGTDLIFSGTVGVFRLIGFSAGKIYFFDEGVWRGENDYSASGEVFFRAVYDGPANTINIYVNGVLELSRTVGPTRLASTMDIDTFGKDSLGDEGAAKGFDGFMKQVSIKKNGVLVRNYPFDDAVGTVARETIANEDGEIFNADFFFFEGAVVDPPEVPEATTATAITETTAVVNWKDVTNEIEYRLDVSDDDFATFVSGFNNLLVTQDTISKTVTGLAADTLYKYRVRSVNASSVASANSNIVPFRTLAVGEPVSTAFYIDPNHVNASDLNAGTDQAPWKTIAHANATLQAGDTVLIKAGTYSETIDPANPGTIGNPITYEVWKDALGQPAEAIISDMGTAVLLNQPYITIKGLMFRKISQDWVRFGSNHCIVDNCDFTDEDGSFDGYSGIDTLEGSSHNRIINCDIIGSDVGPHDLINVRPGTHNLVQGNLINGGTHDAVAFLGKDGTTNFNVIRNNVIINKWHTTLEVFKCSGPNIIMGNTFIDAGLNKDQNFGGSERDRTTEWEHHPGIKIGAPSSIVRDNYVINCGSGIVLSHFSSSEDFLGPTQDCRIYHNTVYKGVMGLFFNAAGEIFNNIFKNNIIAECGWRPEQSSGKLPRELHKQIGGQQTDNFFFSNNFHRTTDDKAVIWGGTDELGTISVASLESSRPLQADNNTIVDPLFTDKANNNLSLQAGSPMIDSGEWLTTAVGAGAASTSLTVEDSKYFWDHNEYEGIIEECEIQLQGQATIVKILSIAGNVLTLDTPLTWADGDGVSTPYSGAGPNKGADQQLGE